ncbi:MAG: putative lipid-binding transport protein (Tim44 family) [Paracoccaceae bacterium]|jgi:predicted lipid-binding transport protein (Tim44 family)
MNAMIQLLVLAAIALFLVFKLRSVLGTREGFEKPATDKPKQKPSFEVIEGGPDSDILDHVSEGSAAALALAKIKGAEPDFVLTPFLQGARSAYEMILMAFENGDVEPIKSFLAEDVYESFSQAVVARKAQGLTVNTSFMGIRELAVQEAVFHPTNKEAEISVRFVSELKSFVRNAAGDIVEGSESEIKRQRDVWTFARITGAQDPNWRLVATGD